jgi:putative membrane protein
MSVIVNLLIWVHLLALAMGFAGGIGMSQVGPRLAAAAPDQRAIWWPLANVFTRISNVELVLLLVTGPLILSLKFHGASGLSVAFAIKMGLVILAVIAIGVSSGGKARLKRGDEGGARLMAASGPVIMLLMLGVVLAAVFAFA